MTQMLNATFIAARSFGVYKWKFIILCGMPIVARIFARLLSLKML